MLAYPLEQMEAQWKIEPKSQIENWKTHEQVKKLTRKERVKGKKKEERVKQKEIKHISIFFEININLRLFKK